MSRKLFQSERGLELSSIQWLLDHHKTKEIERRRMVGDLDFQRGDLILDVGCGPGLWSTLFAEKIQPSGRVFGLDFSLDLVSFAVKNLEGSPCEDVVDFVLGNFYAIPFRDDTFDAVFFGNCCSYVSEVEWLLEENKRVTKPGGRTISKEFDGGLTIFHPVDPLLTLKVLTASAQALLQQPSKPFDNFVGRKMHGVFLQAGLSDVTTRTYAIQKLGPLNEEARRYVTGNAEWYGQLAAAYLTEEDLEQWRAAFDPTSDDYVLDRPDFYFCMVETMTVGRV